MLRVVLWIGVVLAVLLGGLWLLQRRLIYLPAGLPGDPPPGWEPVSITTADGTSLAAWFRPPPPGAVIVVVFNGNAGNRSDRIGLGSGLASASLGVLLFDYRGYGGNPGSPTESGLAEDAVAIADWVAATSPDHPVAYFGESLGAAVAVRLAGQRPPAALILRSPFTSLGDAAAVHYPFLPVRSLLWDEYDVVERIGNLDVPLLVIAGSADSIVPPEQSRAVYEAASGPKTWLDVAGADHNDIALVQGEAVIAAIVDLLS